MNVRDQIFELIDVTRVEPHSGYRLAIGFSDGTEGERDFADMIAEGGEMVEPLRDPAFFARVFLDEWMARTAWPSRPRSGASPITRRRLTNVPV